jgi:hypothetical protein
MNAQTHANDLHGLLTGGEGDDTSGVVIIGDNGPDYAPKSSKVFLNLGRLFKVRYLDFLIVVSYAPGDSAHNPIEHGWAPLSRFLSGVILPRSLPGKKPPGERKACEKLSDAEVTEEECQILDNVVKMLCSYWQGKTYDGHKIDPRPVPCQEAPKRFSDSKELDKFCDASLRKITADPVLKD